MNTTALTQDLDNSNRTLRFAKLTSRNFLMFQDRNAHLPLSAQVAQFCGENGLTAELLRQSVALALKAQEDFEASA